MATYTALKPCSFAGERYRIGESIPDGVLIPGAVKRLLKEGVIAEVNAGLLLPASTSLEKEVEIPLIAEENAVLKLTVEELIEVVKIAQMNEDDIIAQLQFIKKEEQLVLIDALVKSDAVFEAAKELATETDQMDSEELEAMSYNDLKKLAKKMGLSAEGKKEEIVERIMAAGDE